MPETTFAIAPDDPSETTDVSTEHPETVEQILAIAQNARTELGEYMHRGAGQRATGSVVSDAPIVSHEKDWPQVVLETRDAIHKERLRRHPEFTVRKRRKK